MALRSRARRCGSALKLRAEQRFGLENQAEFQAFFEGGKAVQ